MVNIYISIDSVYPANYLIFKKIKWSFNVTITASDSCSQILADFNFGIYNIEY